MKTFTLVVSTPNGNAYEKEAIEISVRGSEGSLAVRAGHIPFITSVKEGEIRITDAEGEDFYATISEGILTVTAEKTTLLCGNFKLK